MFTVVVRTAAALALVASPAIAAKKPPVITVPASVIADPSARICMPRSTSPLIAKDKTLPETICETTAGWAAYGVTLRAK